MEKGIKSQSKIYAKSMQEKGMQKVWKIMPKCIQKGNQKSIQNLKNIKKNGIRKLMPKIDANKIKKTGSWRLKSTNWTQNSTTGRWGTGVPGREKRSPPVPGGAMGQYINRCIYRYIYLYICLFYKRVPLICPQGPNFRTML